MNNLCTKAEVKLLKKRNFASSLRAKIPSNNSVDQYKPKKNNPFSNTLNT